MLKRKKELNLKIEKLIRLIEKSNLNEISYILGNKFEIVKRNLIAGISRGIGIGIGVTIVSSILILILNHLVTLNIPIIGEYIADIIDIVEKSR